MTMPSIPRDEAAERACLAAALLDEQALSTLSDLLREEDLYSERHRLLWAAMLRLHQADTPVDLRTLEADLERRGQLGSVGGVAYLATLDEDLPDVGRVEHYARIIRDRSVRRQIVDVATRAAAAAAEGGQRSAEELVADLELQARRLSTGATTEDPRAIGPVVSATLERIEDREAGHLVGLSTGLADLDRITGGLRGGELAIIAARPGVGKSSLMRDIGRHLALSEGRHVSIYSLEMSAEETGLYLLCSEAEVRSQRLRMGQLSQSQWGRVITASRTLQTDLLRIDDRPDLRLQTISASARRLRARGELDLVAVDYLQLMEPDSSGGRRYSNRNLEIAAITRGMKRLAKELDVPVLLLSQLSRDPERRGGDHRPRLSDLRDSGSIEQDADVVVLVHREEIYSPDVPEVKGVAELIVAKNRHGAQGTVRCRWDGEHTRFLPLDRRHQAAAEEATQQRFWTPPPASGDGEARGPDPF